jgi:hypothetical protein
MLPDASSKMISKLLEGACNILEDVGIYKLDLVNAIVWGSFAFLIFSLSLPCLSSSVWSGSIDEPKIERRNTHSLVSFEKSNRFLIYFGRTYTIIFSRPWREKSLKHH